MFYSVLYYIMTAVDLW